MSRNFLQNSGSVEQKTKTKNKVETNRKFNKYRKKQARNVMKNKMKNIISFSLKKSCLTENLRRQPECKLISINID